MTARFQHKVMIAAGELSGDQRGAELVHSLLSRQPQLKCFGIGGDEMRRAGVEVLIDIKQLSLVGLFEIIRYLPRVIKTYYQAKSIIKREKPGLLLLIDNYGFNIKLARLAKRQCIPVLFYISPQVWATRAGRVKKLAKFVDHMAVVFPFESKCYQGQSIKVSYVGHPLVKKLRQAPNCQQARNQLNINSDTRVVTLMPGSRPSEIDRLLALLVGCAEKLKQYDQQLVFLLPIASTIDRQLIEKKLRNHQVDIKLVEGKNIAAISAADLVIVASGTATLEVSLLERPLITVTRLSRLTAMLVRRLALVPYVSLCNLILNKRVANEFFQHDATVENISNEALRLLTDNHYRQQMINDLKMVREYLGQQDAAEKVADIALKVIGNYRTIA